MGGVIAEPSSAPLADYFFIAGLESSRIFDHSKANGYATSFPLGLGTTIEEYSPQQDDDDFRKKPTSVQASPDLKRNSKRFSWDKRKSISSISGLDPRTPTSNRSSVTIKASQENGLKSGGLSEDDFNAALKKFAADRDSVVAEIQVTSKEKSTPTPKPVKPRPKTQRFNLEEIQASQKSGIGSVRRRLSTINPLTRSSTSRRCK